MPGLRHVVTTGLLGTGIGFCSGFLVAENIYGSDSQKRSVRFLGRLAAAIAAVAVLGTVVSMRGRSALS